MSFAFVLAVWQGLLFLFYGLFCDFGVEVQGDATLTSNALAKDTVKSFYPLFQDVHIMIFVGFGFLMTFLKSHRFGSLALNFLLGALSLQTSILTGAFFHGLINNHWTPIDLNVKTLITGDFGAGAVLISLGAVLGRCSPLQAVIMTLMELVFFALNETLAVSIYEAVDMGGSMVVHTFGSCFGVACAYLMAPRTKAAHPENGSTYKTEVLAMLGTLFLWAYWPSFNGALAAGNSQHRVIVNTVLGLSASCVSAMGLSKYLTGRLDPEDVLNASLAGGVAIGSSSDLVVSGSAALMIGSLGGMLSVVGFHKVGPYLKTQWGIHDTCGVNSLHGMPGILGGLLGAVSAGTIGSTAYGDATASIFPAMGNGRTAGQQAGFQLAALFTSIGISVLGGLCTGWVTSCLPMIPEEFTDFEWVREEEEIVVEEFDDDDAAVDDVKATGGGDNVEMIAVDAVV